MKNLITLLSLMVIVAISGCEKDPPLEDLIPGSEFGGGTVVAVYESGDPNYIPGEIHGLIASENLGQYIWGTEGILCGADSPSDGKDNTEKILLAETATNYAAKACVDYQGGGYNDWYMPSREEMGDVMMIKELNTNQFYWTSTESGVNRAVVKPFPDFYHWFDKHHDWLVYAVRQF